MSRHGLRRRWLTMLAGLALASAGCGKKPASSGAPPELTGLAVVPASAEVIVGADPVKLADAPAIDKMLRQTMAGDATLVDRWQRLQADCKIELGKQVKHVMLALGPHAGPAPGTGPVLMVVVGALSETDLKDCVTKLVGAGGGTLTGKPVLGRTLYFVKDGNRSMYFAFTRADTVVLGADEAYITEALGPGKKAPDNPELTTWRALVNEHAPLWAVGKTDPRIRQGLVQLTEGKITAGPVAFAMTADFTEGAKLQLSVLMPNPDQAKTLETYAKGELALLVAAAQLKSLGSVVAKLDVTTEANVVQFRAALTVDDLNQMLSALDDPGTPAQDRAPPPPGAGSDTK